MKIFSKNVEKPAMSPKDSIRYFNVNKIAESLEKSSKVLENLHNGGNKEAIATWERIVAALQMRWRDAMIEVETRGHYSFE